MIESDIKQEIMDQVNEGVRPSELATKYGVNVANIYQWISKTKKASEESKPKREGSTGLALVCVDQQIDALTAKYQKDLKALLLKQVMQALNTI